MVVLANVSRMLWRTGRDSNPRTAINRYTLSRRAPSTTRPPVRKGSGAYTAPANPARTSENPVEPEQRQGRGKQRKGGRGCGKEGGYFRLLGLDHPRPGELLIDLFQVLGAAGMEILGAGRICDLFQGILVELGAHVAAGKTDNISGRGAKADGEDPKAMVSRLVGGL